MTVFAFNRIFPSPIDCNLFINHNTIRKIDGNQKIIHGGSGSGIGYSIVWQSGSIQENDRNGAFLEDVITSCIHRLADFQDSKYAHDTNSQAIVHLEKAVAVLKERTAAREEATLLERK